MPEFLTSVYCSKKMYKESHANSYLSVTVGTKHIDMPVNTLHQRVIIATHNLRSTLNHEIVKLLGILPASDAKKSEYECITESDYLHVFH